MSSTRSYLAFVLVPIDLLHLPRRAVISRYILRRALSIVVTCLLDDESVQIRLLTMLYPSTRSSMSSFLARSVKGGRAPLDDSVALLPANLCFHRPYFK
jgi:hypothetical protein